MLAQKKVYIWKRRDSDGHRAGCYTCYKGDAQWTGPSAPRKAIAHAKKTGHHTWCEHIVHTTYHPEEMDA